jgi:hypothetical protein
VEFYSRVRTCSLFATARKLPSATSKLKHAARAGLAGIRRRWCRAHRDVYRGRRIGSACCAPATLEANRNVSPLAATRQAEPGVIFCTLVRNQTPPLRFDQLIGVLQQHFAAMPRILARRGRVERSKLGITHATVDRRARTLFARHSSSCRRLCRICVRRG